MRNAIRSINYGRLCKRELLVKLLVFGSLLGCQPSGNGQEPAETRPEASGAGEASQPGTPSGQSVMDAQGSSEAELVPEAVSAVATCAVCHGATGEGNPTLNTPRIGGLSAWYIARQLENFQTGVRGGADEDIYGTQMRAIAMTLEGGRKTLEDLGRHYERFNPASMSETISGNVERGEQLYAVCTACHGEDGRGIAELNTPNIVGQADWYLVRQLEYYRDGLRGSHEDDTYGMQMVPIMQSLSGENAIRDVVAYINTLDD